MDASRVAPMKSVSIMWAEGVAEDEAACVVATVRDLVKVIHEICVKSGLVLSPTAIRPFGTWVIPSLPAGDPYSGTHWYVETAFDPALGQVVAPRFLELVRREPWQTANPHFDVAVLDRDLTEGPGRDSVLAAALPGVATVISVHQLRALARPADRTTALRRLVVHNFGHVLEIPARDRSSAADAGAGERHCTNVCAMRHGDSAAEVLRLAAEEQEMGVLLCPECRRDTLRSVLVQRLSRN